MTQNYPIPHFVGGVSRQPESQRVPGQVSACDNWTLPIERGATARAGTLPIHTAETFKQLALDPDGSNLSWTWINRDSSRRYLVVCDPDAVADDDVIRVFDIFTGASLTVNYNVNGYGEDPLDYIRGGTIKFKTTGDTTFILNTEMVVAVAGTATDYFDGVGTSATDMVDNSVNARYKETYLDFDQPPSADGQYWYATDDTVGRPAGFYVSQNHATPSAPQYARVHTRDAGWRLNGETLPVKMVFNGTSFDVDIIPWAERLSGDTVTNPAPRFVGETIRAMTFHQDRLWFAYNDRVMGSVSGDYYNFFLDNWQSVGDSDYIEIGTSGNQVTHVRHLVSFNSALVLFCTGKTQYEVRASNDGQLTPSSVSIIPTTQYSVTPDAEPTGLGDRLYFMSQEDPIKVYEYYYSFDAYSNMAVDIGLHCQGYFPSSPVEIRTSDSHNVVLSLFDSDRTKLYAYYVTVGGTEKVQSSWCRFSFGTDEIQSFYIYDGWVYLVLLRGTRYYLEKMYLGVEAGESGLDIAIRLDKRFEVTGSYNSTTRLTTWTLPFTDSEYTKVVLGAAFGAKAGYERVVTYGTSGGYTTLSCSGDFTAGSVWVGRPISASMTLTKPFVKDKDNRVVPGVLSIMTMRILHTNAGHYMVNATPYRRETKTHEMNPIRIGSAVIGELTIDEAGEFFCKPMLSSINSTITITSNSHLPVTLVSGSFGIRFVAQKRNPTK